MQATATSTTKNHRSASMTGRPTTIRTVAATASVHAVTAIAAATRDRSWPVRGLARSAPAAPGPGAPTTVAGRPVVVGALMMARTLGGSSAPTTTHGPNGPSGSADRAGPAVAEGEPGTQEQ